MAQYQYQEQDNLMADFDLPAKEQVQKFSARGRRGSKRKSKNTPSYKTEVRKPTLKPNFFKKIQGREATKKPKNVGESTTNSDSTTNFGDETKIAGAADIGTVNYDMPYGHNFEVFSPDAFAFMFTDVKKLMSCMTQVLSNFSMDDLLYICKIGYCTLMEAGKELVNYEEELQYLTSAALLFYGGSWVFLARMLAAVEVFETQQVLEETWKVGAILISDDLEEYDVSPAKIKETLRQLGLHVALMIAITVSPAWAEICISVAFASKFSCLIPVKEILESNISRPADETSEVQEYFQIVDESWFDLLAIIASNILSLTLFACFPRLITAMYMGYLGVSITMKSLVHRAMRSDSSEFEMFDRIFGLNNTTQFYMWAVVAGMSVWQALSGWTGICEFLTWFMFLHPIVKVFNTINADTE
jgi:hypothetical protein